MDHNEIHRNLQNYGILPFKIEYRQKSVDVTFTAKELFERFKKKILINERFDEDMLTNILPFWGIKASGGNKLLSKDDKDDRIIIEQLENKNSIEIYQEPRNFQDSKLIITFYQIGGIVDKKFEFDLNELQNKKKLIWTKGQPEQVDSKDTVATRVVQPFENNKPTSDPQNLDDPSNLAKLGIRSLIVEKKANQFNFRWKAKLGKTNRELRIYFPESDVKPTFASIEKDDENTFTPQKNIPLDQLYTMNIELRQKGGMWPKIFFKRTLNFRESNRFCFPPEEDEPEKSFPTDTLPHDIHEKIEALVSKINDIDESLGGKEGLNERVNNLCKDIHPVLGILQRLKKHPHFMNGYTEQLDKNIKEINASIRSLEQQHNMFGEDIRQIKDDCKTLSHRIEAAENIDEKINDLLSKTRPPQDDFLQSVWPAVEFKTRTLEKLILDHYNKARDRRSLEFKELAPIIEGIQQIMNQESNRLLPEDRTKAEVEYINSLFTPLFHDFKQIYKRIFSDPDTFLKENLSDLEASRVYNHLESLEILSDEPLGGSVEIPDPEVFYRKATDQYLNGVKNRYLEKIKRFSSQAYSSLDELRPDLEKFVAHSVFHFLDSTFHDIFQWHEKLQTTGRGFNREYLERIRSHMMKLCGIRTIEPEVYKSKFDLDFHKEYDQKSEKRYSDHIILKIVEPGYQIEWAGKVLRKCGVQVNYNPTD